MQATRSVYIAKYNLKSTENLARPRRRVSMRHGAYRQFQVFLIMEFFYSELLRMRQDIEQSLIELEEPLQRLSNRNPETTGDIQKQLQDFFAAFCTLSSLFNNVGALSLLAPCMEAEDWELNACRWHISAFWEDYGHIQQIKHTCFLCKILEGGQLLRGLEYLQEQMRDLQAVCEESKKQLEGDIYGDQ
ncbi:hypothetical protein AJ78_07954 [Emergomyces pasteurianus Ep9510]|uniref:Uncharacterized protein n=1 Tax=Emergomyces pasteurianus Ep9510 TaxID=1447872 RepID=A0A1J9Q4Q8_9EURO|nr:hypothetical protein AJ78_07954 [Emergomyces pasteurianus Ep9510]